MMGGRVVLELGSREEVEPTFGVVGAKDAEVCLYFLISMFCLSIGLWVVSRGKPDIVLEESDKLPGESGSKLGASIRYHRVM